MIRSSKHPLALANGGKKEALQEILDEYRRYVQIVIDDIWTLGSPCGYCPSRNSLEIGISLLPSSYLNEHATWLSARMRQAAGKQAVMMLKAATEVRRKQLFILRRDQEAGSVKFLQSKIDRFPLIKPDASKINMELDSRFVDFQVNSKGTRFVRIASIGRKLALKIPIRETKVSRKWGTKGRLKEAVRIGNKRIHLIYSVEDPPKNESGPIIGADQGVSSVLTLSSGGVTRSCPHGHDLASIQAKMSGRRRGSKGFGRSQDHRKNYIGWTLNQLRPELGKAKEVRLEKVQDLRRGQKSSRFLSHWTYTLIKDKLSQLSEEEGFLLSEATNEFRSQRCSRCGWVRKANRKGKTFKCNICDHIMDSDLNAASNLALDLYQIPFWVRRSKINRKGFYWNISGLFNFDQERIVPDSNKKNKIISCS